MDDRVDTAAGKAAVKAIFGCNDDNYEDLSSEELTKLFISRTLVLENMGLTSHAVAMAALGVDQCISSKNSTTCSIGQESPSISVLNELSIQLQHFSRALYAGLLVPDANFLDDWLSNSISQNISNILHSLTGAASSNEKESSNVTSVLEILAEYVRPMSEGVLQIFQWCSPNQLVEGLVASLQQGSRNGEMISYNDKTITAALEECLRKHQHRDTDTVLQYLLQRRIANDFPSDDRARIRADLLVEDAFERAVVSTLGEMLRSGKGCLKGLQMVLAVAGASVPTLPRSERYLRSPLRLASLVVTTCTSFDNTYLSSTITSPTNPSMSQPLMWSLIETTPASLSEFDIDGITCESEIISAQLDAIQAALAVSEIVQCYMTPPPIFLLLGDQGERERRTSSYGFDCSSMRLSRRTYIRDLLTGCGFLVAGLGESISVARSESQSSGSKGMNKMLFTEDEGDTGVNIPSSSSAEVLSNMITLGQALILRLSFEYGKKQALMMSNSNSHGTDDSAGSWTAVAQDVSHLCSYFTIKSVSTAWAGHALLQCMLHYNGVGKDFKCVLDAVLDTEEQNCRGNGTGNLESTHTSLGGILSTLGVESAHMEGLVLKRAVEIFNSVPSCESKELREVDKLLQLLPQNSPSVSVASAVRTERALMELVTLLSTLQVDLLPLQLRLLSPVAIAAKLLEQRPQAYYEVNGKGDFEELYSNQREESGESEDRQDLILRRTMLRDRSPPGARLVRVLSALHPHNISTSPSHLCFQSSAVTSSLHTLEAEIRLELLFAAVSLGELEGAYCLCRTLLNSQATVAKSCNEEDELSLLLPPNVAQRISEATLLLIGMLDCSDPDSRDLHQALRYDLLSLTLASTPVAQLEKCSALWRHLPPLRCTLLPSSPTPSSNCEKSCSGVSQDRDEIHIAAARDALLDMMGRMLRRSEDNRSHISAFMPSCTEMVVAAGVDSSRLADAVGHLLLVEDSEMVNGLIEKLYADLDKKLLATLVRERQTLTHSSRGRNTALDEALVNRVASKGFSRNSAKRAVLATMGEGFQQALSWAVEHSLDEDFEYPIAESVKGALLSERQEMLSSFNPESMRGVLKVLADVSEMYIRHCSTLSAAVTSIYTDDEPSEQSHVSTDFTMDEIYPGVDTPGKTYTMDRIYSEPVAVIAVGKRIVSGEKLDSFEAIEVGEAIDQVRSPQSPMKVRSSVSSPPSDISFLSPQLNEKTLKQSIDAEQTALVAASLDDALNAVVVRAARTGATTDLGPAVPSSSIAPVVATTEDKTVNRIEVAAVEIISGAVERATQSSIPSSHSDLSRLIISAAISTVSSIAPTSAVSPLAILTSIAPPPVRVAAPVARPTVMKTRSATLSAAIATAADTNPTRSRPPVELQPIPPSPTIIALVTTVDTAVSSANPQIASPTELPQPLPTPALSLAQVDSLALASSVTVTQAAVALVSASALVSDVTEMGSAPTSSSITSVLPRIESTLLPTLSVAVDSIDQLKVTSVSVSRESVITSKSVAAVSISAPVPSVSIPPTSICSPTPPLSATSSAPQIRPMTRSLVASRIRDLEGTSIPSTKTPPDHRMTSSLSSSSSSSSEQMSSITDNKEPRTEQTSSTAEVKLIQHTSIITQTTDSNVPGAAETSYSMTTKEPIRKEEIIVKQVGNETAGITEGKHEIGRAESEILSEHIKEEFAATQIENVMPIQPALAVSAAKSVRQERTAKDSTENGKGRIEGLNVDDMKTTDSDVKIEEVGMRKETGILVLPMSVSVKQTTLPPARMSALVTSSNTVLKAHLVSRLRGALDVAEDFTGMGMHAADLAKSIASYECVGTLSDDSESESACEQIFQVCRALATHRRLAAYEFLPQLLAVLPVPILRSVAARTEVLIFVNMPPPPPPASASSPSSSLNSKPASSSLASSSDDEEERAKWAMAALRLLAFHASDDPLAYHPCIPVLFSLTNTYKSVFLFAHLYRGVKGGNITALMNILKVAEDQLTALKTAVITCDGLAVDVYVREAAVAIERTVSIGSLPPLSLSFSSLPSLPLEALDGAVDTAALTLQQSAAAAMSTVTVALKQLQEDVAVLRRVNRIPDSDTVNAKMLLKVKSDDLYTFEKQRGKGSTILDSTESNLQAKTKHRLQALLAMGPHLFPQTITHWVRVVGRQLSLGTADLSYQYACYTLSKTVMKFLTTSSASDSSSCSTGMAKLLSSDDDNDPWSLLASELASCVRRMRSEHTHTLCVTIAGLTLKASAVPLGSEMLFPLTAVPDHASAVLISAICSAVQKLAISHTTSTASMSASTSASASITALYTLSAQQAHTLLPSLLALKHFISAVHEHLPLVSVEASSQRQAFLRHCLDRGLSSENLTDASVEMEDAFVSLLLSPLGANGTVLKLLAPYCEIVQSQADLRTETESDVAGCTATPTGLKGTVAVSTATAVVGEEGRGGGNEEIMSNIVSRIYLLAVDSCLSIFHLKGGVEGDKVMSSASTFRAGTVDLMIRNTYSNFGYSVVGRQISNLYTKLLEISSLSSTAFLSSFSISSSSTSFPSSSSLISDYSSIRDEEEEDGRMQSLTDSCLILSRPCVVFLKERSQVDVQLSDVARVTVKPAVELLTTRMLVWKLRSALAVIYSDLPKLKSRVERPNISLCRQEVNSASASTGSTNQYSLDSDADRELLFSHILAAVSDVSHEVGSTSVAVSVRVLIELLRCWGVSRTNGSLQIALEKPSLPLADGGSRDDNNATDQSHFQFHYPEWMNYEFHFSVWSRMMSLCERFELFEDITEMLILDIDFHCDKITFGSAVSEEEIRLSRSRSAAPLQELMKHLRDRVTVLANSPKLPFNMRYTFGLLAGGEMASQAAEGIEKCLALRTFMTTSSSSSSSSVTPSKSVLSLTLFVLLISLSDEMLVRTVARSPLLLSILVRYTVDYLQARLIAHYDTASTDDHCDSTATPASVPTSASASASMSGSFIYSDFVQGLPDIIDTSKWIDSSIISGGQIRRDGINSQKKQPALPLPLALTPQHLAVHLLSRGYFPQAAQIYWTAVIRRPLAMFSATTATSLLLAHVSTAALPFYFTPSATASISNNGDCNGPLREVTERSWGWSAWEEMCSRAVQ